MTHFTAGADFELVPIKLFRRDAAIQSKGPDFLPQVIASRSYPAFR